MRFRWPFPKPAQPVEAQALSSARDELAAAEAELEIARAAYLRLLDSSQMDKLRLQQAALDDALYRYHTARHAVRRLEQPDLAPLGPAGSSPRPGGSTLAKG